MSNVSLDITKGDALNFAQLDWLINNLPQAKATLGGHAQDIHDLAVKWRINPLFLFAIARHESHFGTDYQNNPKSAFGQGKNMAGLDAPSNGKLYGECGTPAYNTLKVYSGKSYHTIALFREWWHSMNAQAYLLRTKYLDEGLTTVSAIMHKYSPYSDGNDPDAYTADVLTYMGKWAAMVPKAVAPVPPITPTPAKPAGRRAVMIQDSQLYNQTLGTERSPSPKKGETITVLGNSVTSVHKNRFDEIITAHGNAGWVRYDHFKYV